jgi:hypothetical protein
MWWYYIFGIKFGIKFGITFAITFGVIKFDGITFFDITFVGIIAIISKFVITVWSILLV